MLSSRQLRGAICLLWLILWRVLISRKQFEPFLVAAVVGVRRVRSVRSDRTPQTPRTVRTVRTGRLFGGLKSDLRAVVGGLGLAEPYVVAIGGRPSLPRAPHPPMTVDRTDQKLNRKTLLIVVWASLLLFTLFSGSIAG